MRAYFVLALRLSSLALAFLAGYCVELLFTAMDTLIGAFTHRRQNGVAGADKD